ncbi:MAG: SUI1 family translation initiation factor [Planctomycetota bacterium]|jgi:translation initiation factor 1 (eIF-1/SUI1)
MSSETPFKDLFAKLGIEGSGEEPPAEAEGVDAEGKPLKTVVLGYERRSGKEVTTVRDVPEGRREEFLGYIRKAFGTGGGIDDENLVIQGDRRSQLTRWFEGQGIKVRGERGDA